MKPTRTLQALAIAAILFGGLTVFSGGRALFGGEAARAAVGNAVGFVLWFNFLAGFVYMLTGVALWRGLRWGVWAAGLLALGTALVAAAFGVHVMNGGAYETRTVGALGIRLLFWVIVFWVARRALRTLPAR